MIIYLADPVTKRFSVSVTDPIEIPPESTYVPPPVGFEDRVFLVEGNWVFDDPSTPTIETQYPVVEITDIAISDATQDSAGIWNLNTETVVTLTANSTLPAETFTAIVQEVVNRQIVGDLRFSTTVNAEGVIHLPMYFKDSGNYVITAERLNQGLEELQKPLRVSFLPVDLNVTTKIPTP